MNTTPAQETPVEKDIFDTGIIYGSDLKFKDLPAGMYLGLFHGRKDKDEDLEGWGSDGPLLGPFKYVHTTYKYHIRACHVNEADPSFEPEMVEDMMLYKGIFYGDWTVFYHNPKEETTNG